MNKKPRSPEELSADLEKLFGIINDTPDYPCVLLCCAFLEQALGTLLASRLVESVSSDSLLKGALGSYRNRTIAAHSMGLIPDKIHQNLKVIGRIRNQLAHNYSLAGFDFHQFQKDCADLHMPALGEPAFQIGAGSPPPLTPPVDDARSRFTFAVHMMATRMILTALGGSPPSKPRGKEWL